LELFINLISNFGYLKHSYECSKKTAGKTAKEIFMKKKLLVVGLVVLFLIIIPGNVFAQSILESGIYIKESDAGKGRVDSIYITGLNSQNEVIVSSHRANGDIVWEKKGKYQSNSLQVVPSSSSFNRVVGDGVEYFDIISSTSFRRNGVRYVKAG